MEKINFDAFKDAHDPVVEAYRTIRTNLQLGCLDKGLKVLAFTGALANDAKSALVGGLAVVMAQSGKHTLLVDADFRQPHVDAHFGLPSNSLGDCLASGGDFHDVLHRDVQAGLDVLTAGTDVKNPGEVVAGESLRSFLQAVRQEYDCMLLDAPALAGNADALLLSSLSDGVVLVLAAGQEHPEDTKRAQAQLAQAGANVIGCVLNGAQEKA